MNLAIQRAVQILGGQKKFAEKIGVSQPNVWYWLHNRKKVSPQRVPAIVEATNGAVQAHEIRPDLPELFPHPNKAIN